MINLKIARIKKNLTQKQVSEKLGVNLNTVSRWETGSNPIPIDKLLILADWFEVTTDYLLNRK